MKTYTLLLSNVTLTIRGWYFQVGFLWYTLRSAAKVMYTSTNVRDDTIFYNVYSSFFWCSFTQRDGSTGYEQQVFNAITTLLHEISSIMALITMEYRKKPTNRLKNRGDWRVSNSRHPQSQCSALPLSYNRHICYVVFSFNGKVKLSPPITSLLNWGLLFGQLCCPTGRI